MKNFLAFLALILGTISCVTSNGLNQKRQYVDPTGVKTVDDSSDNNSNNDPAEDALKSRIAVLEGELEEVKVVSQRQIAALNEQIKSLSDENAKLKSDLEVSSKNRITEDTRKAAELLWKAAAQDLQATKYTDALSLLDQLIERYPEDSHAYFAHTAKAMVFYAQKKFSLSAGAFAFVAQKYPTASGIQMAWFGQGAGLYKMLKGSESLLFFKQTASRWPKTVEGIHAAQIVAKKSQPPVDLFLAFPNWLKDAAN